MTGGQRAEGQRLGLEEALRGEEGSAVCIVPAGLSKPLTRLCISGDAFLPLSTQNTYTLSPSLTGK